MYQPEITEENIRQLYQLKLRTKKPMTKLLNAIVDAFFAQLEELEWEGKNAVTNESDTQIHVGRIQLSFLDKSSDVKQGSDRGAENTSHERPCNA